MRVQVRHIPMVHVVHADGRGWQFDANDEFHMELWGNHARIRPAGEMYATFHDGDEYCWAPVRICACRCPISEGPVMVLFTHTNPVRGPEQVNRTLCITMLWGQGVISLTDSHHGLAWGAVPSVQWVCGCCASSS